MGILFIFSILLNGCSEYDESSLIDAYSAENKLIYSDGRPSAKIRINATDLGIVLRYGESTDGCDLRGAREAIVNEENGFYYLFYDGQGVEGWSTCLAVSPDLQNWIRKGVVLDVGLDGSKDVGSASSPWAIFDGSYWHMFYLGTLLNSSQNSLHYNYYSELLPKEILAYLQ